MKSQKINLGCGQFKKDGYVNLDLDPRTNPDVVHNLNEFPYPFADNSFCLAEADHVLEHLNDAFLVMKEVWRILEPGGKFIVKVPHFSRGFTHSDHKRGFDLGFPYYFNPSFKGGYSGTHFELEKQRLRWFSQPYLKKTVLNRSLFHAGSAGGFFIDLLANFWPFFCSRVWCYWVGGFEEIEFVFVKK